MSGHVPVLLDEVVEWLRPASGGVFVDCTVGLGGHTRALLEAGAGRVVGFDRDAEALMVARAALEGYGDRVVLEHGDYREAQPVLDRLGLAAVQGVLADLGVSSMQLDTEARGFSFRADAPLDMRMDRGRGPTAADLLREAAEVEIADAIFRFGDERYSRRIARAIVGARAASPLETTGQLAALVRRALPRRGYERIDPATRTFQALRIWVNRELEGLDAFLEAMAARLAPRGRLAIVTFHSGEDRIVKHTLRALERASGLVKVLTKKPVGPGDDEVDRNPRARSARLRAAERLA
jgi:16S rRNA (cytosine1402-N4)-methyltransferase